MSVSEIKVSEIKFGIIAVAAISHRFAGAVRAAGQTVLAAASRDLAKARQFCTEHRIERAYGSYEELFRDQDINVVYIATINADHAAQVASALSYGKHVLCEKPLALSGPLAADLFKRSDSRQLFMMEMQKSLFLPVTQTVKAIVDQKELGELYQVDLCAHFASPEAAWMHDKTQGGVVFGSASYTLEYLDYLLEPAKVLVQAFGTKEAGGVADAVHINLKLDEVLVSSRISMRGPNASYAVFYFERGLIRIPDYWKARTCEISLSDGSVQQVNHPVDYEMVYEIEHVCDCLGKGLIQSPVMTAQRTIRCCQLVDEIMELLNE